jgi:hypothetical protein
MENWLEEKIYTTTLAIAKRVISAKASPAKVVAEKHWIPGQARNDNSL